MTGSDGRKRPDGKRGEVRLPGCRYLGANKGQSVGRKLLPVLLAFAADLFEPGQYGLDVELFTFLRAGRRLVFRRRTCGRNLGRKQGCPSFRLDWLNLGGALDLEIEIDLGAKAERHRIHGGKVGGVPMGTFADCLDGRLGGADEAHDLAVFQLGVVAHQPQDGVRAILPARNWRVSWPLFTLRLGQVYLRFSQPEPIVRVSLAFGKLVTGELPGHDRITSDDALNPLIIRHCLYFEGVELAEISDLVEHQSCIFNQPDCS